MKSVRHAQLVWRHGRRIKERGRILGPWSIAPATLTNGAVSMEDEAEVAARYGQDFLERLRHWGH